MLAAGIEVEVIPGITAGIAVPAALGIPVTHRGLTHGVTFVTGHSSDDSAARLGVARTLGHDTRDLYGPHGPVADPGRAACGRNGSAHTPSCLIENGTLGHQKAASGDARHALGDGFEGPALVVIGEVVRFARTAAVNVAAEAA